MKYNKGIQKSNNTGLCLKASIKSFKRNEIQQRINFMCSTQFIFDIWFFVSKVYEKIYKFIAALLGTSL